MPDQTGVPELLIPWPEQYNSAMWTTQTFEGHIQNAHEMGACTQPGANCNTYYYPGIDKGTAEGSIIKGALDGEVYAAGWDKPGNERYGYGFHIKTRVTYKGAIFVCVYAHLRSIYVKVGDRVEQGQTIALSGNTGNSTGPHLHFEFRMGGVPINPTPFLSTHPTDIGDPVGPPVPPIPPPVEELPKFPKPVLMDLTTTKQLAIHSEPAKASPIVGWLARGTKNIPVFDVVQKGDDLIAHLGWHQYIYIRYQGDEWYEWKR